MILYNMRYRGPYEYDKFVLNVLQIHNTLTLSELNELQINNEKKDSLFTIQKNIDNLYNSLIGDDKTKGICEKIYEESYKIEWR